MEANFSSILDNLILALKEDVDYRRAWTANIAVCFQDEFSRAKDKTDIHGISNRAAEKFIELLTDVEKFK